MDKTNKTLEVFLETLDYLNSLVDGQNMDVDKVFNGFVKFLADESNDLFIYSDRENHPLAINGQKGKILLVYTSFKDLYEATFDNKNADFFLNSAYSVFKSISKKENIEGIYINRINKSGVFVPKYIMKHMVDSVDYLRSINTNQITANTIHNLIKNQQLNINKNQKFIRKDCILSYRTLDEQNKFIDYHYKKTRKKLNLGPISYNGHLTILHIYKDLSYVDHTNITGAINFLGPHFKDVDSFIEWHEKL